MMKQFKAKGYTFLTSDDWTGLWASVSHVGGAEDAKNPGFRQVVGTAQAFGESQVRRAARNMAELFD